MRPKIRIKMIKIFQNVKIPLKTPIQIINSRRVNSNSNSMISTSIFCSILFLNKFHLFKISNFLSLFLSLEHLYLFITMSTRPFWIQIPIYGGPSITLEIMGGFWNFFFLNTLEFRHESNATFPSSV